jgi:Domain of unknown function (DUF4386)
MRGAERAHDDGRDNVNSGTSTARIVGALFIAATVAGVMCKILVGPLLDDPAYLTRFAADENPVRIAALLQVFMAAACAGIAISLYPVLRRHDEALALGSVVFRAAEAILFLVAVLALLGLLTLSRGFVEAGSPASSHFQTLGALLQVAVGDAPAEIAFTIGALMYYIVFYRSRLIPRWLSGWGVVAAVMGLASAVLMLFGAGSDSPTVVLLFLPIGVQEMVLAVRLIVKGFDSSALRARPESMSAAHLVVPAHTGD